MPGRELICIIAVIDETLDYIYLRQYADIEMDCDLEQRSNVSEQRRLNTEKA